MQKINDKQKTIITFFLFIFAFCVIISSSMFITEKILEVETTEVEKETEKEVTEITIEEHKIIDEYLTQNINEENIYKDVHIGDIIKIGKYEQDSDISNGKEDLYWRVIGIKNDKALIITDMTIDNMKYNSQWRKVSWEKSTIRQILNNKFYDETFTDEEKTLIQDSKIQNLTNSKYPVNDYADTIDKIFLLSIDEVSEYLYKKDYAKSYPTEYAKQKHIWQSKKVGSADYCVWWLRTSGLNQSYASMMYPSGIIDRIGDPVDKLGNGIRPAMWISIK